MWNAELVSNCIACTDQPHATKSDPPYRANIVSDYVHKKKKPIPHQLLYIAPILPQTSRLNTRWLFFSIFGSYTERFLHINPSGELKKMQIVIPKLNKSISFRNIRTLDYCRFLWWVCYEKTAKLAVRNIIFLEGTLRKTSLYETPPYYISLAGCLTQALKYVLQVTGFIEEFPSTIPKICQFVYSVTNSLEKLASFGIADNVLSLFSAVF